MQVLIDTNVIVRLSNTSHPSCAIARTAVRDLRRAGHELLLVPQVIYEFWAVATRPIEQNGLSMSAEEARDSLGEIKDLFRILRDERAIYERWETLVLRDRVSGKQVHDARLVAAMLRHGITHLLTFNVRDFVRFPEIVAVAPGHAGSITMAE